MSSNLTDDPGAGHGLDEGADTGLDLTPRTSGDVGPARPARRRPLLAWVALGAIVVAVAFVLLQGLGDATLYFRNADEAVAERDELGTRRFRLQGLVQDDVEEIDGTVRFTVAYNGVGVPVEHRGDPPDLFRPDEAVVLEGRFAEGAEMFLSDRMLIKHSDEYEAENDDRIADAEDGETG